LGDRYVARAVLFDLKPGDIGAVRASLLGELFCPGNLVNQNAGASNNWAKTHYTKT
jgi:tubulin beta